MHINRIVTNSAIQRYITDKIFPLYLSLRNTNLSSYARTHLQMAGGTSSNMAALLDSAKDMDAVTCNFSKILSQWLSFYLHKHCEFKYEYKL